MLGKIFTKYQKNNSGSMAINFAVASAAILIGVGAAIDYSRMTSTQGDLQAIADATALASAKASEKDLQLYAENFVQASTRPKAKVKLTKTNEYLRVVLNEPSEFFLMGAFGFENEDISALAEVPFVEATPEDDKNNINIALILDTTVSMRGSRIRYLKEAANELIDNIEDNADSKSMVSVVPFSNYVRISTANRGQNWLELMPTITKPTTVIDYSRSTGCRVVRSVESGTKVCDNPVYMTVIRTIDWLGCMGSRVDGYHQTPNFEGQKLQGFNYGGYCGTDFNILKPLTTNMTSVRNSINSLNTIGDTYTPAGLIWGWRTLNPEAPFTEAAQNPKGKKIVVLMSDGNNNISLGGTKKRFNGIYHHGENTVTKSQTAADALSVEICSAMKADGIEIYTIAYAINDEATKSMLQRCATSSQHYSYADTTSLKEAFNKIDIGSDVSTKASDLRLSR